MRLGQRFCILRIQQNHISANFVLQVVGCSQRNHFSGIQDGQPIAALCFFHQMRGHDHGDSFFVTQNRQILPQIAPRPRIEPGGRLIQQENRRMMQQSLGQFQPALHAAGKCFSLFSRRDPPGRRGPASPYPSLQSRAVQSVEMSLVHQVFRRCQLYVDALCLKHHADLPA